ncbi:hypothetical protein [Rubinisphaera brasiliensis]|nr:hypothetical protein [Rubinisphaera brasiliensis]
MPAPAYGSGGEMNPYPGLDMYRYGFQQTINDDGLWFSEKLNARRDYKFGVEFMVPVYSEPGDSQFGYGGTITGVGATDSNPPFYFSSPRDPGDIAGGGGGGGGGGNTSSIATDFELQRYFPVRNFEGMFGNNGTTGIRLNWGFENEDGSGLYVNGWYGGESTNTFVRGAEPYRNYSPALDPFGLVGNDPLYILELNALNGSLPIDAGNGVAERITFDALYEMKFSQEAWGAGLQILRPAIAKSDWYEVRPIIGLRYIDIREGFNFRGMDSGAEYEVLNFNDVDYATEFETLFNLDVGFVTTTNNATGEAGFEGRPVADSFNDDAVVVSPSNVYPLTFYPTNPYETQVNASTHSRVAGPEIGLKTDLGGGDNLKVSFLATAGVMATSESLKLNGFGVYNHFVNRVDPDNDELTPDGGAIGTGVGGLSDEETTFEDSSTVTHVSPTFDLSLSAEFRVFQYLPVVRKLQFMEDAKFRTSYGFLWVGNISRPQDSVNYTTYPVNPSLDPRRSGWTMQQWTFGVDWNY